MGMFMASVAFRCEDPEKWAKVRPEIEKLFLGLDGLVCNFQEADPGYAILSPYGEMGMLLQEITPKISSLLEDYAVMATCADSDFDILELYCKGALLEKSFIGGVFEEFEEFPEYGKPDAERWAKLLLEAGDRQELERALTDVDVFAEDNLRTLSRMTGFPIFDDELMLAGA